MYERAGLALAGHELPDYLPALLEFLSLQPFEEAEAMLGDCAHVVRKVGDALASRGSSYAAVFAAILAVVDLPGLTGKAAAVEPRSRWTRSGPRRRWCSARPPVPRAARRCPPNPSSSSFRARAKPADRPRIHTMDSYLNTFLFGIYPYIALAVFLVGSLIRFDREQYTWKSDSSQLLRRGQLRLGSNLFHLGILGIFGGHFVGLLTPMGIWHALGVEASHKQLIAIVAGGIFGVMMLIGLVVLMHRRMSEPRIRATTKGSDWLVLWLLLIQLVLGLASLPRVGQSHGRRRDGEADDLGAAHRSRSAATPRRFVVDVAPVFKLHLLLGMTIFLVFPFTRLVHVWSGFAAIGYVTRAYQVVRGR